jgi:hypothetical protein
MGKPYSKIIFPISKLPKLHTKPATAHEAFVLPSAHTLR